MGCCPSNEGRGYVLRRIMRRAMRHLHMMGTREPVFHRLVPALIRQMGAAYPELPRAETLIVETLRLEENALQGDAGTRPDICWPTKWNRLGGGRIRCPVPSPSACMTRIGFPLDLTQDALREQGRAVDTAWLRNRHGANNAPAPAPPGAVRARPPPKRVWFDLREQLGASEFLGYATETAEGGDPAPSSFPAAQRWQTAPGGQRTVAAGAEPDPVLRRKRRPGG